MVCFLQKTKNSKSQHLATPGCQGLVTPAGAAADGELQTFWKLGRMDLLELEKAELQKCSYVLKCELS